MDVARMQAYCLGKPGAWPDNPWDYEHPVIKVGAIPDDELLEAVDESYRLVVEGLPKKLRPEGWDA